MGACGYTVVGPERRGTGVSCRAAKDGRWGHLEWGSSGTKMVAAAACRGQQPVVRPIVMACRGGSSSMRQGAVRVARDRSGDESSSSMGDVTPVMPA